MTTAVMLAVLAASHGSATLTTTGPAAESLRAQGVKVPAKLVLPVTAGSVEPLGDARHGQAADAASAASAA